LHEQLDWGQPQSIELRQLAREFLGLGMRAAIELLLDPALRPDPLDRREFARTRSESQPVENMQRSLLDSNHTRSTPATGLLESDPSRMKLYE
jgi:hypothetical protein